MSSTEAPEVLYSGDDSYIDLDQPLMFGLRYVIYSCYPTSLLIVGMGWPIHEVFGILEMAA